MNILEVVIGPYPEIRGGVDKMVALLIDGLVAEGCGVTVFVPGLWEAAALQQRKLKDVPIYTLRLRMPLDHTRPLPSLIGWLLELPRTVRSLRAICADHRIAVVHIHTATNYNFYFRLVRFLGGPPYVITFHRGDVVDFHTRGWLDRVLIRWGLAGAAATNAVSRWLAHDARRVFPGLCDPIHIYNGILADRTPPPAAPNDEDVVQRVARGEPYFIMVGTFDPYKGHDIAIRAWGLLPANSRPLLLIVGEGELRAAYVDLIAKIGCGDHVRLTGQLPNHQVQRLMASALAMVFPSRSEGLPYVALEAGLAGISLICTNVPPFDEIVVDGENGVLVTPEDPAALAAAIQRVGDDAELRQQLGMNLRQTVETKFSVSAMVKAYKSLFQRVVGRAG